MSGKENNLGTDDVKKLVWRIAAPSMLAQFVSVLYSIVDRMYIGNIEGVGAAALAGVGVCGPLVTLISSFAFLVGVGGSPLMSIRLGEGNQEAAKRILSNCFLMLLAVSVSITGLCLPLRGRLLLGFGASAHTFPYADAYFTVCLLGTVFALMATGMNQFIICQGYAKAGMKSVLLGAALNIALDPLFIFVFKLGVTGAAAATVLSQMASCAYVLFFLFRRSPIRITFGGYQLPLMCRVLKIGFTPFIIIALDNVMILSMNALLQRYGGDRGDMFLTCATITQSFMLMVTMPLGGITGGTQSILGFNYGARNTKRVLEAEKYIMLMSAGFTAVMFLIAQLAPQLFAGIFTRDSAYLSLSAWAIRVSCLGIIPLGLQYSFVDGLTGMSIVRLSLPLSFFRKLVYFSAVFVFPALWGAQAVFYAEPVSDFLGAGVSAIVYGVMIRKILFRRERQIGTHLEA